MPLYRVAIDKLEAVKQTSFIEEKFFERKGGNAGGEFWGCSKYPTCKGVRQLG
jgi:ssDNA-binding Zn-finger/Zn-ribbon topoisomerase 1